MLHSDGLVNTTDALFVMKSTAESLKILGEIHVDALGLASGVTALLIRFSLLQELHNA
ncbi:adenosylcobinamide-GDP ribazoletransferase [Deinococcus alpinitundrae]|uniref:adenosylcobinamide-GDP ribazoletransferase n=1 Tax=Deinococcus alpinitundrae TaxID=468913 RepID=UPI001ED97033|nr:adenosylcobinamide-GDP ribazoletransferase [Deinococcus alpinitundrae]